ncbi:hypothetical protein I0Q12_31240 [Rhodococcus sp. CX]|uniref:hypothetical protein n=1 Tax=Rhodococcus sp. CX TaxID=2789880 RepID=UPI0018CE9317|nr:hypothetical protein [Rhodococcus sp. CX]MBH0123706.1 hypothetical protein [Rhodococcus sp. CX]
MIDMYVVVRPAYVAVHPVYVVVHPDLVHTILHTEVPTDHVEVLCGILGCGKSAMLKHIELNAPRAAVRIDLSEFDPGHRGDQGPEASVGAIQASYLQFVRLLEALIGRIGTDADRREIRELDLSVRNAEVYDARIIRIEDFVDERFRPLDPIVLADAWRNAAGDIAHKFATRWNAMTEDHGCFLLLDNADDIADQEIGLWIGELVLSLSTTVVVFAQESDTLLSTLDQERTRITRISQFDEPTVEAWLCGVSGHQPSSAMVRQICAASGGHPAVLKLLYQLLSRRGDLQMSTSDPVFDELVAMRSDRRRAAHLAQLLVRSVSIGGVAVGDDIDELMASTLDVAAVPRQFDAPLLRHLLGPKTVSGGQVRALLTCLADFPFVEDLSADGSRLRVTSLVRSGLLELMRASDPDRFADLNRRATSYYRAKVSGSKNTSYGESFVYEDPAWQRNKREWLVHSGLASRSSDRSQVIRDISLVFLDAFWWWGNYVHFDFCDQLVADLGVLAGQHRGPATGQNRALWDVDILPDEAVWPELDQLHGALRTILQSYPLRSAKPENADWVSVRQALLQVKHLCGLHRHGTGRRAETLKGKKRRLAALLDIFMAHTYRYAHPADTQADFYYLRALRLLPDDWNAAWVEFELAQLLAGRTAPDPTTVEKHFRRSSKLIDEDDEELAANLLLLRADMDWEQHRHDIAADEYGQAVRHAYLFHGVERPDDYTMQFYIDVRGRALNRLLELADHPADALDCASRMAGAFPPGEIDRDAVLGAMDASSPRPFQLARALFPRGPESFELGSLQSPFMDEFRLRHDCLHGESLSSELARLARR